jgi:hypothetical protein
MMMNPEDEGPCRKGRNRKVELSFGPQLHKILGNNKV